LDSPYYYVDDPYYLAPYYYPVVKQPLLFR
jgi:hypothetical protein